MSFLTTAPSGPSAARLLNNKDSGVYACRLCGLPLFQANAKFESGTGWPSFYQPFDPEHITEIRDISHGMVRTEIRCRRCDGHLGHVFPDGPPPTHQRYCLNSVSMEFYPAGKAAGTTHGRVRPGDWMNFGGRGLRPRPCDRRGRATWR